MTQELFNKLFSEEEKAFLRSYLARIKPHPIITNVTNVLVSLRNIEAALEAIAGEEGYIVFLGGIGAKSVDPTPQSLLVNLRSLRAEMTTYWSMLVKQRRADPDSLLTTLLTTINTIQEGIGLHLIMIMTQLKRFEQVTDVYFRNAVDLSDVYTAEYIRSLCSKAEPVRRAFNELVLRLHAIGVEYDPITFFRPPDEQFEFEQEDPGHSRLLWKNAWLKRLTIKVA